MLVLWVRYHLWIITFLLNLFIFSFVLTLSLKLGSVLEEMDDKRKVLLELKENIRDRLEEEDAFNQKV